MQTVQFVLSSKGLGENNDDVHESQIFDLTNYEYKFKIQPSPTTDFGDSGLPFQKQWSFILILEKEGILTTD
jgi:hypothetical protein